METIFFETPAEFRAWLDANHADAGERGVGFRRKACGLPSISWQEAVGQPPGYRRLAAFWVTSAKREETRAKRLRALIEHSAKGERLPGFSR